MAVPDLQPTLRGEHVVLRPAHAGDWPEMFEAAADPLIWAGHPVRERYKAAYFRAFFDDALASRAALTFVDRSTGKIIGSSRYDGYDPLLSEIEIGWTFLARSHWGGVYNGEIKRLMLDHAFTFIDCVLFMVGETNLRSKRAVEKIGGVRRPELFDRAYQGVNVRHIVYEIRRPATSWCRQAMPEGE